MVSLKTPDSPVEKKRIDFATMHCNGGVHQLLGTQSGIPVNEAENGQKSKQNWRGLRKLTRIQLRRQVKWVAKRRRRRRMQRASLRWKKMSRWVKRVSRCKESGEVDNWEPAVSFRISGISGKNLPLLVHMWNNQIRKEISRKYLFQICFQYSTVQL